MRRSALWMGMACVVPLGCSAGQQAEPTQRVYVMRHGAYGADGGLSAEGEAQVQAALAQLAGVGITRIYHAPARRCVETAQMARAVLGEVELVSCAWLAEGEALDAAWRDALSGPVVLIVTHSPVARAISGHDLGHAAFVRIEMGR